MLLKISKFFLYVSVFCVLVVMTSTFFPFIGGKDYFFRFSVELALIFYILWWAFEAAEGEAWSRLKNALEKPLFVAVSVFVLIFLLACIFAYDSHGAFWSNYERGEGGFQMLHYYAFFVLLVLLFKTKDDWRLFFKVSLAAAALMILYGVFANLGWASNFISPYSNGGVTPSSLWHRLVDARFQGSLGNPAYVAPYLLFSIFYAAYLWVDGKHKMKSLVSLGYSVLILLFLFFFFLSQTRGAFLGLGAAVFTFLACAAFSKPEWRKRLVVLLVILCVGAAFLIYERHSDFVKSLPGGRLFDIAFSDQTVQTRLWTWGSAWQGFKERPILGWGPENFSPVFDKYFDPRHFVPGKNTETWFDRAHSVFFDYLTETGMLGFLSYLAMFAVFYWELFKKGSTLKKSYGPVAIALMISLPAGYLVQGIAIFDVLPMYINLFLFLAFGCFWFYNLNNEQHA
jgi:O-antigen ligase